MAADNVPGSSLAPAVLSMATLGKAGGTRILVLALVLVCAVLAGGCSSGPKTYESILLEASDGTVLHGRIYGSGTSAVILFHDFGSTQKAWETLANTLAGRGFLVLTYDMRGHGDSPGLQEVGPAATDGAAAVRYLRRTAQRQQVLLVGEGLGGSTAIKVASQESTLGIVTVSAYSEFKGLSVLEDIPRIIAPKLFIAAEGDAQGSAAAKAFQERAKQPSDLKLVTGNLNGAALRAGLAGQEIRETIVKFLSDHKGA